MSDEEREALFLLAVQYLQEIESHAPPGVRMTLLLRWPGDDHEPVLVTTEGDREATATAMNEAWDRLGGD